MSDDSLPEEVLASVRETFEERIPFNKHLGFKVSELTLDQDLALVGEGGLLGSELLRSEQATHQQCGAQQALDGSWLRRLSWSSRHRGDP